MSVYCVLYLIYYGVLTIARGCRPPPAWFIRTYAVPYAYNHPLRWHVASVITRRVGGDVYYDRLCIVRGARRDSVTGASQFVANVTCFIDADPLFGSARSHARTLTGRHETHKHLSDLCPLALQ